MIVGSLPARTWRLSASSSPARFWTTPWKPRPASNRPVRTCWPNYLGAEAAARRERYLMTGIHLAHLPFQRTLEQFHLGLQPQPTSA